MLASAWLLAPKAIASEKPVALASLLAPKAIAMARLDSFEELALELAGTVLHTAESARGGEPLRHDPARIVRVLRYLESRIGKTHTLGDLARVAGLSRYHFLRTFKSVTGTTPHQWLRSASARSR